MISSPIRLIIPCVGGIAVVGLVVWGVFGRSPADSANVAVTPATSPIPALTNTQSTPLPVPTGQNFAAQPEPVATANPSSSPQSGLPLGVTKEATEYNKAVYAKLPGIKPPVINTDGRNLGPEATQALEAARTPMPFPGTDGLPAAQGSVSPILFPKTMSEIQQLLQPKASPSPAALGN